MKVLQPFDEVIFRSRYSQATQFQLLLQLCHLQEMRRTTGCDIISSIMNGVISSLFTKMRVFESEILVPLAHPGWEAEARF